jgi:hypothetical protein
VPSARGLTAALGLQRRPEQGAVSEPAAARLVQVQAKPPLAPAPVRVARRRARGPVGASLAQALPPQGSARAGRVVVLRLPARQAPWRWVQALAQQQGLPGPGQAHARRARQCQAAPGLAVLRAF